MPCIAAPNFGLPSLGIAFPALAVPNISLPGFTACCTFQPPPIDMWIVNQAIAAAIGLLPAVGKLLFPLLTLIQKYIYAANKIMDKLQFSCPLN